MSLFKDYGETGRLYTIVDSNSTKRSQFNLAGSYDSIDKVVIIRPTTVEALLAGDQMIAPVANLDTTVTPKKGQILYTETSQRGYLITGEPRYNRLFKRWKVELKKINVTIA
jgi:hypothetical protein